MRGENNHTHIFKAILINPNEWHSSCFCSVCGYKNTEPPLIIIRLTTQINENKTA